MILICFALTVYTYILFARVIISFVFLFKPDWNPPEGIRPILNFIYALTDPPVNYLRRFVPSLQAGAMALDLGFLVWFLFISITQRVLC